MEKFLGPLEEQVLYQTNPACIYYYICFAHNLVPLVRLFPRVIKYALPYFKWSQAEMLI